MLTIDLLFRRTIDKAVVLIVQVFIGVDILRGCYDSPYENSLSLSVGGIFGAFMHKNAHNRFTLLGPSHDLSRNLMPSYTTQMCRMCETNVSNSQ